MCHSKLKCCHNLEKLYVFLPKKKYSDEECKRNRCALVGTAEPKYYAKQFAFGTIVYTLQCEPWYYACELTLQDTKSVMGKKGSKKKSRQDN